MLITLGVFFQIISKKIQSILSLSVIALCPVGRPSALRGQRQSNGKVEGRPTGWFVDAIAALASLPTSREGRGCSQKGDDAHADGIGRRPEHPITGRRAIWTLSEGKRKKGHGGSSLD